ncbi:hypothetical protein FKP32DRAFT_1549176, partial [Trametes sanguinea]
IDKFYLSKSFKAKIKEAQQLIDHIVEHFSLNEDQERAFQIVANHAVKESGEHLKMYLGNMAGTGRSQVIKAMTYFFSERQDSYQFMCMAPTGSEAALIGGSTYHSMLALRKQKESSESVASLLQVCAHLQNVEYIFIDEISMVDCHGVYTICAKMASAL